MFADRYTLDGKPLSPRHSVGMMAAATVGSLAATPGPNERAFVEELWRTPVPVGDQRYFDGDALHVQHASRQRQLPHLGPKMTRTRTVLHIATTLLLTATAVHSPLCLRTRRKIARRLHSHTRGLPLATTTTAAPLYVDTTDWPGVLHAVSNLASDINQVTNHTPEVLHAIARQQDIVIIGTIGRSPIIDKLIAEHKLDVTAVRNHWETSITQTVPHPLPGVRTALVIAGADKRGTIFAIYDLSEQIGVSPWAWWADVPIRHQDALYIAPGRYLQPEPRSKVSRHLLQR